METFDAPRGTRDFLPDRMAVRNHVERVVRDVFESFGFQHLQTPTFEQYELLAARSGEEIKESMFAFASDAGRYALRPELTSPVCRIVASGKLDDSCKPHRLYYFGPCFRYCRPQEGRYREFFQAGIELFGASEPIADAESIAVAHRILNSLNIADHRLKVGNVGVFRRLLDELAPENRLQREEWEARVLHDLDRLMGITAKCRLLGGHASLSDDDKAYLQREANSVAAVQKEAGYEGEHKLAKADSRTDGELAELPGVLPAAAKAALHAAWTGQEVIPETSAELILRIAQMSGSPSDVREQATQLLKGTAAEKPLEDLWAVCEGLQQLGVTDYEVVLGTVRNLDFYTGAVFEIDSPHLGSHRQLCGGGRYDTLVEDFGGPSTPATGLAFSFDRLVQVFESNNDVQGLVARSGVEAFVLTGDPKDRASTLGVAQRLREQGIRTAFDLMNRSPAEQTEHAKSVLKAACLVNVKSADACELTDVRSGKTQSVAQDDLAAAIKRLSES